MAVLRTSLLLAALALLAVSAQKAPRFKACKRNQTPAKLNECARDSLQKAVPELVIGIPEYGLKTIDPLKIASLEVAKGKTAVSVDLSFKNLDIHGLRHAKIKSLDVDVDKYKMKSKVNIEGNIMIIGGYSVKGKVLVLPIEGNGRCNITLVNPKGEITELVGKKVVKNGKEYVEVTSLKFVVYDVDRVIFDLKNLFNGNKQLGDNMNIVLNENWKQIFEDLRGPVQVALGSAFKSIANSVLLKVPYNKIFT